MKTPWLVVVLSLSVALAPSAVAQAQLPASVKTQALSLYDQARKRPVPVTTYTEEPSQRKRPLAIISHGYGGKSTDYSFIAVYLATHGYFVASIQHEIPGDEPLPATGNPYETRKP